jgi:hypothetical protein
MSTTIIFKPVIPDGVLATIANTHQYSPTVEVDSGNGDGKKITQPNPQSAEEFALAFLENKWLLTLEHEITYPETPKKSPLDFAKLKEQTIADLKALSTISI